jgi:glucose/arabinose dehydrogenase
MAFAPSGEFLYISYSDPNGDTALDEYAFADGAVDLDSRRSVYTHDQPFPNHNGGNIVFGPDDRLYLGLGDGGSAGDPLSTGQDPSDDLGSLLRFDEALEGEPEVWSYGLRNPWRFTFDRQTGDLWVGDVGQNLIEEIDFLPATDGEGAGEGANLGWSEMEGSQPYEGGTEPDDHVRPIFDYANDGEHCSVTGGYVYRGSAIPWLEGAYVYGDFCFGELRFLRQRDGQVVEEGTLGLSVGNSTLASFGEDADGELYVLSLSEGAIYKFEAL